MNFHLVIACVQIKMQSRDICTNGDHSIGAFFRGIKDNRNKVMENPIR